MPSKPNNPITWPDVAITLVLCGFLLGLAWIIFQ